MDILKIYMKQRLERKKIICKERGSKEGWKRIIEDRRNEAGN